jgi:AcrR family transcriptional regulator
LADARARRESGKDGAKKAERERRILDVAAELLQKWGYKKITLEDIARVANVSKATIYLSWKTREALFIALIEREQTTLYREIMQRMEEDPEGMTLPGMARHVMIVTLKNPLMKALVLGDVEFLGELITHEYNTATYQAQMQGFIAILEFLRKHGMIRNDIDLREQATVVASVSWGFLLVDPLLPEEAKLSDERMVEQIYLTLKRLLEPDIPPSEEQRRAGRQAFQKYMRQYVVTQEQQTDTTEADV